MRVEKSNASGGTLYWRAITGDLRQQANPLQTEPAHKLAGIANVRVETELNIGRVARPRARPDKTPRNQR